MEIYIVLIYDYIFPFLSVIFFSLGIYYTALYLKFKKIHYPYDWIYWFMIGVCVLWIIVWANHLIILHLDELPILTQWDSEYFFVRLGSLLTGVGTAILQKLKYMKTKKYGGITWN